ncbi:hypothetical protein NL108_013828 [Boleophthalmus pectinirostris]|nr:hypothetical protein NL108_013828 [Boleophthalmus pectinirostris]
MSVKVRALRGLVLERLAAAADEIFALFERTFAQYEEEVLRTKILQQPRGALHREDIQTVTVGEEIRSDQVIEEERIKIEQDVNRPIPLQYPTPAEETGPDQSGERRDGEEPGCSNNDLSLDDNRSPFSCSDTDDSDEWAEEMTKSNGKGPNAGFKKDSAENNVSCDNSFNRDESKDQLPKCTLCYKTFKNMESLEKHLEFHPGPFTCQVCNKVFSSKSNYKTHLLSHTERRDKPHKCPVCGRGFLQRCHVKDHMRIHTGEKPYSCTECGKSFRQQNSLMRHVLSMHSEDKPYKCSLCPKGFVQKPYLESHMRKHTGEKPFVCLVCGKCYKEKYCLKKHMSLHLEEGDITSQVIQ